MDGVTILAVEQTYTVFEAILMGSSLFGVVILGMIAFSMLDENLLVSCVFVSLTVVLIIACIRMPRSEVRYEVTVDESVSYQELSARYEIVSRRGQIITVREKEQKNDTDTEDSAVSE